MDFAKDTIYHKRIRYNCMFVIIDCLSKFCYCFIIYYITKKNPEQLINCYDQLCNHFQPNICGGIWNSS